jgi:hypothetical protein
MWMSRFMKKWLMRITRGVQSVPPVLYWRRKKTAPKTAPIMTDTEMVITGEKHSTRDASNVLAKIIAKNESPMKEKGKASLKSLVWRN